MNNVSISSDAGNNYSSWGQCAECKEWMSRDDRDGCWDWPVYGWPTHQWMHPECAEVRKTRELIQGMDHIVNGYYFEDLDSSG